MLTVSSGLKETVLRILHAIVGFTDKTVVIAINSVLKTERTWKAQTHY